MRLAVLGDMHGNAVALQEVLNDMKTQSPDAVICLGDIVFRGPQPSECIELVKSINPLITVRGNVEDLFNWFPKPNWQPENERHELIVRAFNYDMNILSIEEINWLSNLPLLESISFHNTNIEIFHATPESLGDIVYPWASLDELNKLHKYDNTNLSLFGHVHHAFTRQSNGRTIVNAGSAGFSFDRDNRASYAIIDIDKKNLGVQLRRVEYDIDMVIKIAKEKNMPDIEALEYGLRHAIYPYSGIPTRQT